MTPQERQLVDDLFDRLSKVEGAPRDPDATAAISQGLRQAPNALYALVQTVLLQDEALKRAHNRIQELEARDEQPQAGGFLDRCAKQFSGKRSAARCRMCGRPSFRVARHGTAARSCSRRRGRDDAARRGRAAALCRANSAMGGAAAVPGNRGRCSRRHDRQIDVVGSIRSMIGSSGDQQSFGDTASAGDGAGHRGSVEDRRPWAAISPAAIWRRKPGSTTSVRPDARPAMMMVRQRTGLFDNASRRRRSRRHGYRFG